MPERIFESDANEIARQLDQWTAAADQAKDRPDIPKHVQELDQRLTVSLEAMLRGEIDESAPELRVTDPHLRMLHASTAIAPWMEHFGVDSTPFIEAHQTWSPAAVAKARLCVKRLWAKLQAKVREAGCYPEWILGHKQLKQMHAEKARQQAAPTNHNNKAPATGTMGEIKNPTGKKAMELIRAEVDRITNEDDYRHFIGLYLDKKAKKGAYGATFKKHLSAEYLATKLETALQWKPTRQQIEACQAYKDVLGMLGRQRKGD